MIAWVAFAANPIFAQNSVAPTDLAPTNIDSDSMSNPKESDASDRPPVATTDAPKEITTVQKINQANALVREGQFEAAIRQYDDIPINNPLSTTAAFNRGVAKFREGDFESAKSDFGRAVESSIGTSTSELATSAYYNLANCDHVQAIATSESDATVAMGLLESAIEGYRRALRIDSTHEEARTNVQLAKRLLDELKANEAQEQEQKQEQDSESEKTDQEQPPSENSDDQNQSNDTNLSDSQDSQDESSEEEKQSEPNDQQSSDESDKKNEADSEADSEADNEAAGDDATRDQDDGGQPSDEQKSSEPDENDENEGDDNSGDSKSSDSTPPTKSSDQTANDEQPTPSGDQTEAQPTEQDPAGPSSETEQDNPAPKLTPDQLDGNLTSDNAEDANGKAPQAGTVMGEPVEGELTKEEAMKLLQSIRDRDMLRRLRLQYQQRSRRMRVDRDW
jgi:Ca-activated chloride channel family protein